MGIKLLYHVWGFVIYCQGMYDDIRKGKKKKKKKKRKKENIYIGLL